MAFSKLIADRLTTTTFFVSRREPNLGCHVQVLGAPMGATLPHEDYGHPWISHSSSHSSIQLIIPWPYLTIQLAIDLLISLLPLSMSLWLATRVSSRAGLPDPMKRSEILVGGGLWPVAVANNFAVDWRRGVNWTCWQSKLFYVIIHMIISISNQ